MKQKIYREYHELGVELGRRNDTASLAEQLYAQRYIHEMYTCAGLVPPKEIVWVEIGGK